MANPSVWQSSNYPRPGRTWLIAFGWISFITCFALISTISMISVMAPPSGSHLDKILHTLAYGALTFGMIFAVPRGSLRAIFAVAFVYGGIIEFLQGTLGEGRTMSLWDALANGLGALIIIGLWMLIYPLLKQNPA